MCGFLLVFYSNFVLKTHRFLDIRLQKCRNLENWVRGPSRWLKMSPFDRAHFPIDVPWQSTPSISYRFRDRRWLISVENRKKNSHHLYFCAPAEGVPLGIGYRSMGSKTRVMGATGLRKKFDDIFSPVDTIHQSDRRTDRWTPGDSKDRAYA